MRVLNVKFADYNGQDNLYFEVDVNLKEMLIEYLSNRKY